MRNNSNKMKSAVTSTPAWGVVITLPNGGKLIPHFRGSSDAARLGAAWATAAGWKAAAMPVTPALLENHRREADQSTKDRWLNGGK